MIFTLSLYFPDIYFIETCFSLTIAKALVSFYWHSLYFTSGASGSEEDLTKEILVKVFQDLPGASSSITKIIDNERRWDTHRMDAIHSKRIQLLGFDTCRRMALDFMKSIVRDSRNRSASLDTADASVHLDAPFRQNGSLPPADAMLARRDVRKRENKAEETRMRMLKSLDLHLAAKQRDYTAKLMRTGI